MVGSGCGNLPFIKFVVAPVKLRITFMGRVYVKMGAYVFHYRINRRGPRIRGARWRDGGSRKDSVPALPGAVSRLFHLWPTEHLTGLALR